MRFSELSPKNYKCLRNMMEKIGFSFQDDFYFLNGKKRGRLGYGKDYNEKPYYLHAI